LPVFFHAFISNIINVGISGTVEQSPQSKPNKGQWGQGEKEKIQLLLVVGKLVGT
jgi:hypothetical protein